MTGLNQQAGDNLACEVADKVACKPEIHGPTVPRGTPAAYAAMTPQYALPNKELCQWSDRPEITRPV
ncbi:hypothetical protein BIY29_15675 [Brenneria alni]|uniref:Uncharacterized protein n=1 Tax=Brenneria alni TaxID=71656 RepID=A0A421DKN5_9GAMM|nr:hypothetical protein BIY29_15675 [Brenneria alni]